MRALSRLLLAAGLALSAAGALAQVPAPNIAAPALSQSPMTPQMRQARMQMRQVCKPDMDRLCPGGQETEKSARRECVKAHRAEFSQPCTDAMMQMRSMRKAQASG